MTTQNLDDESLCEEIESDIENDTGVCDYTARQAMPLDQQSLSDFDDLFQHCDNLAYAFVVDGQVNTVQPNVMAALGLLDAAQTQQSYFSPSRTVPFRRKAPTTNVAALIQERAEEMIRREIDFVLVWHMPGDDAVHIETSPVLEDGGWDVYLSQFLSKELHKCLRSL